MKLFHVLAFAQTYLWQIVLSTGRLAVLVLQPRPALHPRFVEVPLDLRGEMPRFLFACLITMTPGSLSVGLDRTHGVLIVHLLNAPDPDAAVRAMKETFETPLIRIFGRASHP